MAVSELVLTVAGLLDGVVSTTSSLSVSFVVSLDSGLGEGDETGTVLFIISG